VADAELARTGVDARLLTSLALLLLLLGALAIAGSRRRAVQRT
jgi:hypothetical protein